MDLEKLEKPHNGQKDNVVFIQTEFIMLISPRFLFWSVVAIITFHIIAMCNSMYFSIWWLDIPMHFFGGAWVALLFFAIFGDVINESKINTFFGFLKILVLAIAFAVLVGVLWEFFEFSASRIFNIYLQGDLVDTMTDLLMDLCGGLSFGILGAISFMNKLRLSAK